jgi:hypothetical protein
MSTRSPCPLMKTNKNKKSFGIHLEFGRHFVISCLAFPAQYFQENVYISLLKSKANGIDFCYIATNYKFWMQLNVGYT